jgi:hypothetical protein
LALPFTLSYWTDLPNLPKTFPKTLNPEILNTYPFDFLFLLNYIFKTQVLRILCNNFATIIDLDQKTSHWSCSLFDQIGNSRTRTAKLVPCQPT